MHHHDTMKTIAKAYLSNREYSVPEPVYHILPEFKLKRIFPAVYFINANLPGEQVQVLLPEKELSELPDIDRYMERPKATFTFCDGK